MEDNQPTPSTTSPPAERTAQALRELHERARTALAAQRERMGQLEAQLTHQLDTIADTLAEQVAADGGPAGAAQPALKDVERLRAELEKTRLEWNTERETWQAERAQLSAADGDHSHSLDQGQAEVQARQQALDERAAELNHQDRELRQRQELLDAHSAQSAEKQSELFAAENALEKKRADLAERETAIQKRELELDQARDELKTREQALQTNQTQLAADRAEVQKAREEVDRQLQAATAQSQVTEGEAAARLASAEQQLATERTAWDRERANVEDQRRLLAQERDNLSTALEAARGELAAARTDAAAASERDELRQKFELALEDVQRLRARVAELEQELTSRPVANETDSVELVHLRAEHDAMAERIAELQQNAAAAGGAGASEELSDLQKRFELAVEDVRDLKKRNAELEDALSAAKSGGGGGSAAPAAGGSWEAMKRKMLANLEGEGDDVDDERQEERATIEDTIRITDDALARKDREIAELKSQLADGDAAQSNHDEEVKELLDKDEVIAEHRARIAKLEEELTAKLREAELELSVERAKITRETAQLADLRAEIDSRQASGESHGSPGTAQQPKRRWLSKLGLSGDEEGK